MTAVKNTIRCTFSTIALAGSLLVSSIPADARTGAASASSKNDRFSRRVTVGVQTAEVRSNGYAPVPFLILGVGY